MKKRLLKAKCSLCGCTGIHACMGDRTQMNNGSINALYKTIDAVANHIRREEAIKRLTRNEERKNGKDDRSS